MSSTSQLIIMVEPVPPKAALPLRYATFVGLHSQRVTPKSVLFIQEEMYKIVIVMNFGCVELSVVPIILIMLRVVPAIHHQLASIKFLPVIAQGLALRAIWIRR
jgi:hypothetical protein